MPTGTRQRFGSFDGTLPRAGAGRVAGLAAVLAAWLVVAAPVSAQPSPAGATVYVHSAKSGELRGGRLILHGVASRVTWAHSSGRSGVLAVKRVHRRLFSAGTAAVGTLHVAGHRGGDEPTFRLSNPRYNRARRTVSYRVRALDNKQLPGTDTRAAGAARSFGPSSLTMIAASSTGQGVWDLTQTNEYACASGTGTCWGTLGVLGLDAGATVTATRHWSDGVSDKVTYQADQGGDIKGRKLELPCPGSGRYVRRVRFLVVGEKQPGPSFKAPC
jgi:hypothetical protein